MSELKIDLMEHATQGVEFKVTLELIEEMAKCIYDCSWVSGEEIAAYMKSCITDGNYNPDEWSVDGKGQVAISRDIELEKGE